MLLCASIIVFCFKIKLICKICIIKKITNVVEQKVKKCICYI